MTNLINDRITEPTVPKEIINSCKLVIKKGAITKKIKIFLLP